MKSVRLNGKKEVYESGCGVSGRRPSSPRSAGKTKAASSSWAWGGVKGGAKLLALDPTRAVRISTSRPISTSRDCGVMIAYSNALTSIGIPIYQPFATTDSWEGKAFAPVGKVPFPNAKQGPCARGRSLGCSLFALSFLPHLVIFRLIKPAPSLSSLIIVQLPWHWQATRTLCPLPSELP